MPSSSQSSTDVRHSGRRNESASSSSKSPKRTSDLANIESPTNLLRSKQVQNVQKSRMESLLSESMDFGSKSWAELVEESFNSSLINSSQSETEPTSGGEGEYGDLLPKLDEGDDEPMRTTTVESEESLVITRVRRGSRKQTEPKKGSSRSRSRSKSKSAIKREPKEESVRETRSHHQDQQQHTAAPSFSYAGALKKNIPPPKYSGKTTPPKTPPKDLRRSPRKRAAVDTPVTGHGASPSKRQRNDSSHKRDRSPPATFPKKRLTAKERPHAHRRAQPPVHMPLPESWQDPKLGWVFDQKKIAQRTKDLHKGYTSASYQKYVQEVPKDQRIKGVHPRTPNKWVDYPRRSWDTQVRQWRKAIHIWAGDTESQFSASLNTSFISEAASSPSPSQSRSGRSSVENVPDNGAEFQPISDVAPTNIADPNDLASLLGHYDLDSRRAFAQQDEDTIKNILAQQQHSASGDSTLKGHAVGRQANDPTDFSVLSK